MTKLQKVYYGVGAMNKLNKQEATKILKQIDLLEARLQTLSDAVWGLRTRTSLPDFEELQKYDNTSNDVLFKVGYLVEDIETCLANIDQEIADAGFKADTLRNVLKKI